MLIVYLVANFVIGKSLSSEITFSKVDGQNLNVRKSWNVVVVVVAAGPPHDLVISGAETFYGFSFRNLSKHEPFNWKMHSF